MYPFTVAGEQYFLKLYRSKDWPEEGKIPFVYCGERNSAGRSLAGTWAVGRDLSPCIKEDGVYVDGEEYSHYQERLPFRLYDSLEFWTIPVPKLLIDEIRKHLPKIRL